MSTLLFCPVRLAAEMVPDLLASHAALEGIAERVYLDDCEPEASAQLAALLPESAVLLRIEGLSPSRYDSASHSWPAPAVQRLATIRNIALEHFLRRAEENPELTHLLMVDADLLLHPATVVALERQHKPVISSVFWTRWRESLPWLPNCWDEHGYTFHRPESILQLREPGLYPVGGTGACTLIRRDVLLLGVNYSPIPGWAEWGEDRWFSLRCAVAGISLHCSSEYPAFHVHHSSMIEEGRRWREAQACDPDYFRREWLTESWAAQIRTTPAGGGKKQTVIACCLPGERFSSTWVAHWTTLFGSLLRAGSFVVPTFAYSSNVYVTRASLWQGLQTRLAEGFRPDYLLWLDDDNLLSPEQLDRMIQTLEERPEIAVLAGWCWVQPEGHLIRPIVSAGAVVDHACVPLEHDDLMAGDRDLREVEYTGFPAVLMRGQLLEQLGPLPFMPRTGDQYAWGLCGEDVAFCLAARQAGCRIWVDRRIQVPHLKLQPAQPLWTAAGNGADRRPRREFVVESNERRTQWQ